MQISRRYQIDVDKTKEALTSSQPQPKNMRYVLIRDAKTSTEYLKTVDITKKSLDTFFYKTRKISHIFEKLLHLFHLTLNQTYNYDEIGKHLQRFQRYDQASKPPNKETPPLIQSALLSAKSFTRQPTQPEETPPSPQDQWIISPSPSPFFPSEGEIIATEVDPSKMAPQNHTVTSCGIENPKNRCYLNAAIKALSSCPEFCKLIEQKKGTSELADLMSKLFARMTDTKNVLQQHYGNRTNPSEIEAVINFMANNAEFYFNVNSTDQQDSAEFLNCFFNLLFDEPLFTFQELNRHSYEETQRIGHIDAQQNPQKANLLSLPLPKTITSLQEPIVGYVEQDAATISGKEQNIHYSSSKRLINPPNILPIQLKRYEQQGREIIKSTKSIDIPFILKVPTSNDPALQSSTTLDTYILRSVVIHSGGNTIDSGHYYTYMPDPTSAQKDNKGVWTCPKWVKHNDTVITEEKFEDIEIKKDISENSYLLFYEKISADPT